MKIIIIYIMIQDIENIDTNTCDYCRSPVVTNDQKGIIVCTRCGIIKEDRFVNQSSEYRYFNDDSSGRSDPRRVGNSVNRFMDAQIDLIEIGDFGRNNYMTYSLQSNSDKAFTRALKLIKKYCDFLDLPMLQRPAEEIYFEIKDNEKIKGKRMETLIAAVIFIAGKRSRVFIQMTSLEPIADVSHKKILTACNVVLSLIPKINDKSEDYIKQFGAKLKLSREVVIRMEKICKFIENYDIFDKKLPKHRTIAAAVIYFCSQLDHEGLKVPSNLQDIKEASGVQSDNTIKKYYQALMDKKDRILKEVFKDENAEQKDQ